MAEQKNKLQYGCHVCERTFIRETNLKAHIKKHEFPQDHSCEFCGRKFSSKLSLNKHWSTHGKDIRGVHKCQFCDKMFFSEKAMKCHTRQHTLIPSSLRCNMCSMSFSKLSELKKHLVTSAAHAQQRQTAAASATAAKFAKHEATARPSTQKSHVEKKTAKSGSALQCKICSRKFRKMRSLKCHLLTHSRKEKLYSCSVCGVSFGKQVDMEQHQARHADTKQQKARQADRKKTFECETCDEVFSTFHLLVAHEKKHGPPLTVIQIRCLGEPSVLRILMGS